MRVTSQTLTVVSLVTLSCFIVVTKSDIESSDKNNNNNNNNNKNISNNNKKIQYQNYRSTARLLDGEYEVRMRFGNVIVRETSAISPNTKGERKGLLLRQVASDSNLLQMIYKTNDKKEARRRNKLIECEITNDWSAADQFRTQFQIELRRSGLSLDVPSNHMNQTVTLDLDDEYDDDVLENDKIESVSDNIIDLGQGVDEYQNVTLRVLRNEEVVGEMFKSFDIRALQKQCHRLHQRMKQVTEANSQDHSQLNLQLENKNSRVKRGIHRFALIPGTDWCGGGSMAADYNLFSSYVGAERCCRAHDQCQHFIPSYTTKYNHFNYRFYTICHCYCDEKFRSCLKMVNTGAANLVGKLFFNIMQTTCFTLKPEKTCVSNSPWWGKCLKYTVTKTAHIQEPIPY